MIKKSDYGFRTPERRIVSNNSGNTVGGELSGGECQINPIKLIELKPIYEVSIDTLRFEPEKKVFQEVYIYAIGIIFRTNIDINLKIEIKLNSDISVFEKQILANQEFIKTGFEFNYEDKSRHPNKIIVRFEAKTKCYVELIQFEHGMVYHKSFDSEKLKHHYYNSKRQITIPEQFYLDKYDLPNTTTGNSLIVYKSCNRCQRFLPINHFNERKQISFSNHCVTKAPCRHSNFSNYEVLNMSKIAEKDAVKLNIENNFIKSYYGHQLECKACKKFFVNAPLNPLRNSTQHREDSLRRRAFEILTGELLETTWIYHKFRVENKKEFDVEIWKKFNMKCFKCSKPLESPKEMDLDHTMPLSMLYPLDKSATCLCSSCNSAKSDIFPVDFYNSEELVALSKLTGLDINIINSRKSNQIVVDEIKSKKNFILNEFLQQEQYLKVRDGKRVADSIVHSLQKAIDLSESPFKLLDD